MTMGSKASVNINKCDPLAVTEVLLGNPAQSLVRPSLETATEEEALGMSVLAFGDGDL